MSSPANATNTTSENLAELKTRVQSNLQAIENAQQEARRLANNRTILEAREAEILEALWTFREIEGQWHKSKNAKEIQKAEEEEKKKKKRAQKTKKDKETPQSTWLSCVFYWLGQFAATVFALLGTMCLMALLCAVLEEVANAECKIGIVPVEIGSKSPTLGSEILCTILMTLILLLNQSNLPHLQIPPSPNSPSPMHLPCHLRPRKPLACRLPTRLPLSWGPLQPPLTIPTPPRCLNHPSRSS